MHGINDMTESEAQELINNVLDHATKVAELALVSEQQLTALKLEIIQLQLEIQLLKIQIKVD